MARPEELLPIGAHVSSSGGLHNAIENAEAVEAEALQTFASNNRTWRKTNHKPDDLAKFRELREASALGEVWFHNIYLPNLATDNPEQLEKSIDAVVHALTVADAVSADGVVLHTGSHRGAGFDAVIDQVVDALQQILAQSQGEAILALENAAGQGGVIGGTFQELGVILERVGSARLQVCFDTCHAFAAGYDVADAGALKAALDEFDGDIGLGRLAVIHANDSKMERGANRDRHENIGDGHIGAAGFRVMMAQEGLQGRTWLLEVPGPEGKGPDLDNVRRLKKIRAEVLA